ncbi:MAG: hypothetical protein V3T17_10905 [Pseudomonadales bacterium]
MRNPVGALLSCREPSCQEPSCRELLTLWECGSALHAIDRALLILGVVYPQMSGQDLAALPIGERNVRLLKICHQLFNPSVECLIHCPGCREMLEFQLDVAALCPPDHVLATGHEKHISHGDLHIRYRLINSDDLAELIHCRDKEKARDALIRRCLVEVEQCGKPLQIDSLPDPCITEPVIEALEAHMQAWDPYANIFLNLDCPYCNTPWREPFDIVDFLWKEIVIQAKRLMQEIGSLARHYGWSENDILSMSLWRRRVYLQRLEVGG